MGTGESEGEGRAVKAAELAINNPLIDDYTLKGAKGLLVNITGGKDLKLFEVDEAVNKVRAEVDPEAELIIGAITDEALDGKMRVSIVATSLDGQQPEAKSVINMVHRIQNRNPGYSDFQNTVNSSSFNFSATMTPPISEGATALKLENEISQETTQQLNETINSEVHSTQDNMNEVNSDTNNEAVHSEIEHEEEISTSNEETSSNGLENFEIKEDIPELFNSESDESQNVELTSLDGTENENKEENDLEIPAFLRRQKH
jgi:cell division protein FtsZ